MKTSTIATILIFVVSLACTFATETAKLDSATATVRTYKYHHGHGKYSKPYIRHGDLKYRKHGSKRPGKYYSHGRPGYKNGLGKHGGRKYRNRYHYSVRTYRPGHAKYSKHYNGYRNGKPHGYGKGKYRKYNKKGHYKYLNKGYYRN